MVSVTSASTEWARSRTSRQTLCCQAGSLSMYASTRGSLRYVTARRILTVSSSTRLRRKRVRLSGCSRRVELPVLRLRESSKLRSRQRKVVCRHRLADEVNLGHVTADGREEGERDQGLDGLRHNAHVQLVAQRDGRANQGEVAVCVPGGQARQEAAVKLQLADGEAAEVCERRYGCTEVVDGYAQSEIPQLRDHQLATLELPDDGGLGDLEDQR